MKHRLLPLALVCAGNLPDLCSVERVLRDYVLLSSGNPHDAHQRMLYVLDKATGEVRENPFYPTQSLYISPVLCETSSDFLVVTGLTRGKRSRTLPDETTHTEESLCMTYALMDKRDFFEDAPCTARLRCCPRCKTGCDTALAKMQSGLPLRRHCRAGRILDTFA